MFEVFVRSGITDKNNEDLWVSTARKDGSEDDDVLWIDLHVSSAGYKEPDPLQNKPWLPFEKTKNGEPRFIKLDSGHTVILQSEEIFRTGSDITGIVSGSAGCSIKGLLATSGKVDPNFGPQNLAVAVQNVSDQAVWISEGDKIAVVAFCRASKKLDTDKIVGPAKAASDLLPNWLNRILAHLRSFYRRYKKITFGVFLFYIFTVFTQAYVRSIADAVVEMSHHISFQ